ncbi:hypothetical protein G7L40_20500 [Paenibacillus polymyxa]|uniref:Uncharacterized protein n=1 Tax=Paenibacillus polymyxa TaxID=1406 RepID=A0A378Y0Z9_PAEPO|nr:hypothetical protein [Paenibacillus polymyxa]MBE7896129.1 hypothetical protein [Paenibacillus polymyxa]MBG9765926.1 hypothetical protein [Paenibacillus polymyxa]MCC3256659.1 hypothetical protein [Paenibacillus polymyxa]QPK54850.1 hypothetical protein G7035_20545 [Paenibacillus polymyxa]QPK59940.1 hypothetical protein G7L40_20500 [Paenibacillus polymyxa]
MSTSTDYVLGYNKGRMVEAEETLRNLYIILDQMTEIPHYSNHIMVNIRDLEKATGKNRKYFSDEENAFD